MYARWLNGGLHIKPENKEEGAMLMGMMHVLKQVRVGDDVPLRPVISPKPDPDTEMAFRAADLPRPPCTIQVQEETNRTGGVGLRCDEFPEIQIGFGNREDAYRVLSSLIKSLYRGAGMDVEVNPLCNSRDPANTQVNIVFN